MLCSTNLFGQEKRQIVAYKLQEGESIKIDGELGDATWLRAESSSNFIQ